MEKSKNNINKNNENKINENDKINENTSEKIEDKKIEKKSSEKKSKLSIRLTIKGLLSFIIIEFFLFQILGMNKTFTNNIYPPFIIKIKSSINSIFCLTDISIGDLLYLILSIFLFIWILRMIYFFIIKNKKLAFHQIKKILLLIAVLYFVFMTSFGLLYDKPYFEEFKTAMPSHQDYKAGALFLVKECARIRENLEEDSDGNITIHTNSLITYIYSKENINPNIKISLFSKLLSKIGISGYYNPFTNEAQYISSIPKPEIPFTIGHEIGHQLGYAKENDASFYSFLIGNNVRELPEFEYSVKLNILLHILKEIKKTEPEFITEIFSLFTNKMQNDYNKYLIYYRQFSKKGNKTQKYLNDTYLKVNSQEGIITYQYIAQMVVNYYKKNGFI